MNAQAAVSEALLQLNKADDGDHATPGVRARGFLGTIGCAGADEGDGPAAALAPEESDADESPMTTS